MKKSIKKYDGNLLINKLVILLPDNRCRLSCDRITAG